MRLGFALAALASAAFAASPEELALAPYTAPRAPDVKAWPREKLVAFMRELAEFVYAHHVVSDPERKTFGMVMSFGRTGNRCRNSVSTRCTTARG